MDEQKLIFAGRTLDSAERRTMCWVCCHVRKAPTFPGTKIVDLHIMIIMTDDGFRDRPFSQDCVTNWRLYRSIPFFPHFVSFHRAKPSKMTLIGGFFFFAHFPTL